MPRLVLPVLALLLLLLLLLLAPGGAAAGGLPLGPRRLPEQRSTRALAPGVSETEITRGFASARDVYTVEVAFVGDRGAARDVRARLRAAGFDARIERFRGGFSVRTGSFAEAAAADALRDAVAARGFAGPRTLYTGEDGRRTTGPWRVHVLSVDPVRFGGALTPALATGVVPGREPVSTLAARRGALAGVNGGYFVIGAENGTDGDLAGISEVDGALVSEAVDGRTSLVLPDRDGAGARIEALRTADAVRAADGARRELDGLDRAPGLIRGCGGTGGDAPTERPKHDFTCTDASELILFTPAFGAATDPGPGAEAVLGSDGTVRALRDGRGGAIPADGSVLAGTGDAADWLRVHATPGRRLDVSLRVRGEDGPVALGGDGGIVNGGPRLLRGGRVDVTAAAEGFVYPEDPSFLYGFGLRRNPRTLAGVDGHGRVILVAIDGRRPGFSVGASFAEEAAVARALGARDAVNLDGGGSTTMTVGSSLVTTPSDPTGERPIGDALLVLP